MSTMSKPNNVGSCVTMPSVHGRPNVSTGVRNRIGYHQRNLSLDFRYASVTHNRLFFLPLAVCFLTLDLCVRRSMGILLPPVSQITTKITSHHRNRSLDSALQRIPEVDVTPSPEYETAPTKPPENANKSKTRPNREDLTSLGSDDSGIICRYRVANSEYFLREF